MLFWRIRSFLCFSASFIEVKHQERVDASVEKEMQEKIARVAFCGEKSKRAVLVCLGEVDAQIAEDGYFDAIIPFGEILGQG